MIFAVNQTKATFIFFNEKKFELEIQYKYPDQPVEVALVNPKSVKAHFKKLKSVEIPKKIKNEIIEFLDLEDSNPDIIARREDVFDSYNLTFVKVNSHYVTFRLWKVNY